MNQNWIGVGLGKRARQASGAGKGSKVRSLAREELCETVDISEVAAKREIPSEPQIGAKLAFSYLDAPR